ncbi:uncharacterized protein LOC127714723 isoform X1 [Mytilus californianus]|uniref:uncharacterized protein LOC127714723 isoform X1 n=1 Tax=Mytilus californianus TaxID=6549 RepID=UPI002246C550|nr:uncharacterized protein LOC127714723 isoform X1 [Mytilus californianus]
MPSTPVNRNLRSANRGTESEEQRAESINTTIETTQQRTETVGTTTGTSLSTTAEFHSESGTPITLQTEGGAATNMQQQEQTPEVQQIKRQVSALISPIAILFWIFIMLAAFIQLSEAKSTHKQILKLNYGIIFEKQGRIHFGKPTLVKGRRKSKRAILSFVGQLSKTLFNTATMDDVNLLARHINALTTRTLKLTNTMAQHDQHESSYMASVDKRISNLVTQISDNHNEINMMQKSVLDHVRDAENLFLHLQAKIIESFSLSSKINQQLEQLKLGIFDLVQGKLSPLLIKPSTITSTINRIQQVLNTKYPGFYISQTSQNFYYDTKYFVFSKHKSDIFVMLNIPLAYKMSKLDLYKVTSLPFPHNSTTHATQLLNTPQYVAITKDKQYYIKLSDQELEKCTKYDDNFHCQFTKSFSTSKSSCLMSIYNNQKEKVNQFCDFRFLHDVIKPKIVALTQSSVVIYKTTQLNMDCNGKQIIKQGCDFCIIQIPCRCSILTTNLYIPPSFTNCKTSNNITTIYPINLALLQQFFNAEQLKDIQPNSTFSTLPNIAIPNFKMYNHSFSTFLSNDKRDHLSLTKMAEATKQEGMVFHNLAEPLLEGIINVKDNWPDLNGILGMIGTVLASISIIFAIWAFFKIKILTTALIILQGSCHVKSMTAPSFIYKNIQTTTSNPITSNLFKELKFNHILVAIIGILIVIVVFLMLYKKRKSSQHTFISLEITTGSNCLTLPLCKLPLCPSYWTFSMPPEVKSLSVSGIFRPSLHINWDDFIITNTLTQKSIVGPKNIKISFWEALRLKQILKQPFFVYILLKHNNMYKVINEP